MTVETRAEGGSLRSLWTIAVCLDISPNPINKKSVLKLTLAEDPPEIRVCIKPLL